MLNHKGSVEIKTDRLLLRKFNIDDAEQIFSAWTSDERVAKYTSWHAHKCIEYTRAVIKFLFNDVNYRKIIAGCDSENIGSSKVMEKVGMKREAVLREQIKRKDGTWGDDFQYGLLRREFEEK